MLLIIFFSIVNLNFLHLKSFSMFIHCFQCSWCQVFAALDVWSDTFSRLQAPWGPKPFSRQYLWAHRGQMSPLSPCYSRSILTSRFKAALVSHSEVTHRAAVYQLSCRPPQEMGVLWERYITGRQQQRLTPAIFLRA